MTLEQIQSNCKRIAELTQEIDALKEASRQEFLESQKEMVQLLFNGVMPEGFYSSAKRGRPKGSTNKGPRQPRSIESRFAVALTRLMNTKAIPSVTADRQEAERLLNDSADRVASKNGCDVPESVWAKIDLHITQHYGPKKTGGKSKGKSKSATE